MINELLESQRRSTPLIRTTPGGDEDTDTPDPEWREGLAPEGDELRSRGQQDYDTLIGAVEAGVRSEQSAAVTHEVVVHVSASDLEARRGQGWISGVLAGIPIPVIERKACTGGIRLLVSDDDGEALYLGRSRRLFSPGQKKVLTARAGGRCEFPGCGTLAPFLEAHHVAWFDRQGGRTDIGNGVMLCSHHHHLIHASTAGSRSEGGAASSGSSPNTGAATPPAAPTATRTARRGGFDQSRARPGRDLSRIRPGRGRRASPRGPA